MKISPREVDHAVHETRRPAEDRRRARPARNVDELAQEYGVRPEEVRRFTEYAMLAEEDPRRERRVRELARRIARGEYLTTAEEVVDMAERRAIADRCGFLEPVNRLLP